MRRLIFIMILLNTALYGQNFDGYLGSKTLSWLTEQKDFNSIPRVGISPMSIKLWDNYQGTNAPSQWGSLLEINGRESHLVSQLYFIGDWANDRILYRNSFYGQAVWKEWRYILDSQNDIESIGNLKITGNANSYILNGNVGIGTTNPNSRLDLGSGYGTKGAKLLVYNDDTASELSGTKMGFYIDNFTSNNLNLVFPEAINYPGLFTITAKNTSGTLLKPYFAIAGLTGNVGIGTIDPQNKLDVNGTIHSKEVKVDMNGWPDYVFKKDYNLPTLIEVENHIKEKGHLENIPSEQEVLKNGIDLGEMNAKLLQKIEELTLYMIEQNKNIDSLMKENKIQNEEITNLKRRLLTNEIH